MNASWASVRTVWRILGLLAAAVTLVLSVAAVFTGNMEWLTALSLVLGVFFLPDAFGELVRVVRGPKPRTPSHVLLARWPLLLLSLMLPAVFAWAIWLAFGRLWVAVLIALGFGLPMLGSTASLALMEPSRRKDRVFLACIVAMFAVPVLTVVVFALVGGAHGG